MSRPARSTARSLALATGLLAGCNFQVPSTSYLVETRLITVLVEVVELGPLNPDRVAVPVAAPIAEAMPQDRLALEAFVVDRSGARVPVDELDSLWFQCGVFPCGEDVLLVDSELFDRGCDELGEVGLVWNTDAVCRLGAGDGRFEFVVPELGQLMVEARVASYYGVIGWAGRTAQSCWEARRARVGPLDNCGFIQRTLRIGPSWWMLAYAESLGLESPIPIAKIPAGVYFQQANRAPVPNILVYVDGAPIGVWPGQDRFAVEPGSRIEIESLYEPTLHQFIQAYFTVNLETYLFEAQVELIREYPYTSNGLVWLEPEFGLELTPVPQRWEFAVDEYADPGVSRVVLHYFDDRYGDGVAILEFEVGG